MLSTGCQKPAATDASATSAPTMVEVIAVAEGSLSETVELPCSIEGYEQAMLMSRVEGFVKQVSVNIGDSVSKQQELAILDVPELAAEVDRRRQMVGQAEAMVNTRKAELEQARSQLVEAEAQKGYAESKLTMVRNLVDGGALKSERLEEAKLADTSAAAGVQRAQADIEAAAAHVKNAETAVEVAMAEVRKAEAEASYTRIVAPFDGLITQRGVDPGALVRPAGGDGAKPLLSIASVNRVRVVLFVPMNQAKKLDDGDPVELHGILALAGESIPGKITRHAKAFHEGSRMMRAEVDLDNVFHEETGTLLMKPGDYGKVLLTLQTVNGPEIPKAALIPDGERMSVMVVDSDNKCSKHDVTVAMEGEETVVLASGLEVGERVVADPKNVKDGQVLPADQIKPVSVDK